MDKYRQCIMWLTATFGAVTHHAKSFATPRFIRLLDFFFLLKNSARNFFLTRNICSIFLGGFAQPPHQKSNGLPIVQNVNFCLIGRKVKDPSEPCTDWSSNISDFRCYLIDRFLLPHGHLRLFMTETTRWSRNNSKLSSLRCKRFRLVSE